MTFIKHMETHKESYAGKTTLCINLIMHVYNVYKSSDCNRVSDLSPLSLSVLIHSIVFYLYAKIFFKRRASRAFPSKLPTLH